MKKLFAICAMSAFLFTACGGDSGSSAGTEEPVSSSAVKKSSSSQKAEFSSSAKSSSSSKKIESSSSEVFSSIKSSSSSSSPASSSFVIESSAHVENKFVDSRDGQVYKTTVIGGDVWMAQNLNFAYMQPTLELDSSSYCYHGRKSYCDKYGRLYIWSAAMDSAGVFSDDAKGCGYKSRTCAAKFPVRGVCPEGWHLPSALEYEDMFKFIGAEPDPVNYWQWKNAGIPLKSTSDWKSWSGVATPTDEFGFSVLPSGEKDESGEKYYEMGEYSYFNTSTSDSSSGTLDFAFFVKFSYARDYVEVLSTNKRYARPVRCKKN